MEHFRINMDLHNLDNRTSTFNFPIWGTMCVEYDAYCFPGVEWHDAVSSLLDMWLSEIIQFINTDSDRCELDFMDGPFVIYLNREPKNCVCVSLIKRPAEEYRKFSVPLKLFVKELLKCVNLFVDKCNAQSIQFVKTNTFRRILENSFLLDTLFFGETQH